MSADVIIVLRLQCYTYGYRDKMSQKTIISGLYDRPVVDPNTGHGKRNELKTTA